MNTKLKLTFLIATTLLFSQVVTATGFGKKGEENKSGPSILLTDYPSPAINTFQYTTAIGVRGLGTSGLTIKHFQDNNHAIEGIIGFGPDAFSVTALWETYTNAFDQPGLNWYYGVGGHISQ